MNLEQQLRTYGDQLEAYAEEVGTSPAGRPGTQPSVGDGPLGERRGPGARALVLGAAAVVLVAVVVGVAARRGPAVDTLDAVGPTPSDPTSGLVPPPPPGPDPSFSLWLNATRVPPGPAEVVAILVNHDGRAAVFGLGAEVERWNGQTFVPHRHVALCTERCSASLQPLDVPIAVQGLGLSPTVEHPGPVERFSTEGLDVGWYRLKQTSTDGLAATAVFEVAADAAPPPPLWPTDRPALAVSPALVDARSTTVTLSALIPGVFDVGELADAFADRSPTATVERWDGSSWVSVTDVPLASGMLQPSAAERTTGLPALDPGAYQLVHTGPLGKVVGSFWVRDPAAAPRGDAPVTTVEGPAPGPSASDPTTPDPTAPGPAAPGVAEPDPATPDSNEPAPVEPELHPWPAGGGEQAFISGVLAIAPDGCSTIGGRRAAWPAGTVFEADRTRVRLTDGRVYAAGTELELGGGHHRADELADPARCPEDDVVFVW